MIDKAQKDQMLSAVRSYLEHRCGLREDHEELPLDPFYNTEAGLFVTLNKKGELRGCIGYIHGIKPLGEALFDMAESAAFQDPRFQPVMAHELDSIQIEISVLSPLLDIEDYHEIEIGTHGVILRHGQRQAVFLPQVAPEQGWDLHTMLKFLSMKAGCRENAYKDQKAKFQIFTAEVFHEMT